MRHAQASWTAKAVATMRVIASSSGAAILDPGDLASAALLSSHLRGIARASAMLGGTSENLLRACFRVGGHLVDHVALRTRLIDRMIAEAIDSGARQLILLGAGLDARAYRMPELRDVKVFEVDHPASQHYKIAHSRNLNPTCRALTHVALDFNKDDLVTSLLQCGYQSNVLSCFVCEGVFPYLIHDAVAQTLDAVSRLSVDGSRLVATYLPSSARFPTHVRLLARPVLRLLGEPFGEDWSPNAFAEMANTNGFQVVDDLETSRWPLALGVASKGPLFDYERLALLERYGCVT